MSKEFVKSVESGNNIEAERSIHDALSTKVGDALENKRKELSNTFVNNVDQEADVND